MTTLTETCATTTSASTIPGTGGDDEFVMLNMDALVLDQNLSHSPRGGARDDDLSVDTTLIARSVGSVVNRQKNAFLRSLTIGVSDENKNNYKNFNEGSSKEYAPASDFQWDITFADPVSVRRMPSSSASVSSTSTSSSSWGSKVIQKAKKVNLPIGKNKHKHSITIASIEGHAALSRIAVGDVVTKINGKKIGPSYNAQRCSKLVHKICSGENSSSGIYSSNNTTFISIQTGNENGLDTVLEATVLKPHPGATAKDLGLEVWWWRGLCVRAVKPNSMFEHSGLKIDDELESINGISLTYNDKVTAKDFNRIFQEELPCEVTIVVKRCKHRYSGEFE